MPRSKCSYFSVLNFMGEWNYMMWPLSKNIINNNDNNNNDNNNSNRVIKATAIITIMKTIIFQKIIIVILAKMMIIIWVLDGCLPKVEKNQECNNYGY